MDPSDFVVIQDAFDYVYRVMLVGESGAGKSSLVKRYATGVFDQNLQPTDGIANVHVQIFGHSRTIIRYKRS